MPAPLGVIAGNGQLPFEVLRAARDRGLEVAVAAIEANTDPAIESLASGPFTWVAAGELERLIAFLKGSGARQVVFAGGITKPELLRDPAALRPDARALGLLARLVDRGDDAILRAVAGELEAEGLEVIASTVHLGERLTPAGPLTACPVDPRMSSDLELGLRVSRALGVHDVGQSVVVKEGTVLAVEAVEGTDAAIRRGAGIGGAGAVVVKASKPGQDLRFDVPAIGPETIEVALEAKLAAIGLEAGRTIVLEREQTLTAAERAGIAVVGLRTRDP